MSDTIPYDTPLKQCTKCEQKLPATKDFFYACKSNVGNLRHQCKTCEVERSKAYRASHQEETRQCSLAYEAENREKRREKNRRYNKTYPEKIKATKDAYRAKYPERIHAIKAAHRSKHIEKARTYERNRRALKRNAPGTHTTQDIRDQYERQKGKCYYCFTKLDKHKYHVDHIIPLIRGGSNWPDNLVIACPHCNTSKQDLLLHEWHQGGRLL